MGRTNTGIAYKNMLKGICMQDKLSQTLREYSHRIYLHLIGIHHLDQDGYDKLIKAFNNEGLTIPLNFNWDNHVKEWLEYEKDIANEYESDAPYIMVDILHNLSPQFGKPHHYTTYQEPFHRGVARTLYFPNTKEVL